MIYGSLTLIDDEPLSISIPTITSTSIVTLNPFIYLGVNAGTASVISLTDGVGFTVQSNVGDRSIYNYTVYNNDQNYLKLDGSNSMLSNINFPESNSYTLNNLADPLELQQPVTLNFLNNTLKTLVDLLSSEKK